MASPNRQGATGGTTWRTTRLRLVWRPPYYHGVRKSSIWRPIRRNRARRALPAGVTTGGGERARRRLAVGAGMAGRRAGCERGQEAACRRRLGHGREEDETQQRDGSKRAEELPPSEAGEPSEGT